MASKSTYTQHYSDFVGIDVSSDPRSVARNRLAYSVNMWRDYESEQGAAIETFPGFRLVAPLKAKTNGMYQFRSKNGGDYLVVHAGKNLYAFETNNLAGGAHKESPTPIPDVSLADNNSTGFLFNNNLYILDGENFIIVSGVAGEATESITASKINAYIPTTYFDGKPYEQRNMLSEYAYEIVKQSEFDTASSISYEYSDRISTDKYALSRRYVKKYNQKGYQESHVEISAPDDNYEIIISEGAFADAENLQSVDIICKGSLTIGKNAFANCKNLQYVRICIYLNPLTDYSEIISGSEIFEGCSNLRNFELYCKFTKLSQTLTSQLQSGVNQSSFDYDTNPFVKASERFNVCAYVTDISENVEAIINYKTNQSIDQYDVIYQNKTFGETTLNVVTKILLNDKDFTEGIKIKLKLHPNHFSTIENVDSFLDGNPEYKKKGIDAINGCTKSAVFDGRIFLTGNSDLPNTVFYSNRNLTGANDPTYFGAYNYFNDGVGNTPNVELLATPSMLMVLKNNTVQDASIYYHVGAYNTDEFSKNLVPRIYPSTAGAAGVGSAGAAGEGVTCINFLDDPIFLSQRGVDAVGKETVNLERTVTHRSSNVDRLLIKEDLPNASITEWKGYLVICINGHMYLADSRYLAQHPDGSLQYEWYYLEGLGTYEEYVPRWRYLTGWMGFDEKPYPAGAGEPIKNYFDIRDQNFVEKYGDLDMNTATTYVAYDEDNNPFYYVEENGIKYLVGQFDGEMYGSGKFYPATRVLAIGERLYFGTTNGDICCVNTDLRNDQGRFDRDCYTFNGVAYKSECSTRLDDCDKKAVAKATVCGTTVAVMKPMEGSKCNVNISLNGRDWHTLCVGKTFGSSFDFSGFDFSNFSFAENETNFVKLPELTRNWINKQYFFYSNGYKEPFGLYELSYIYYVKGKIRRI